MERTARKAIRPVLVLLLISLVVSPAWGINWGVVGIVVAVVTGQPQLADLPKEIEGLKNEISGLKGEIAASQRALEEIGSGGGVGRKADSLKTIFSEQERESSRARSDAQGVVNRLMQKYGIGERNLDRPETIPMKVPEADREPLLLIYAAKVRIDEHYQRIHQDLGATITGKINSILERRSGDANERLSALARSFISIQDQLDNLLRSLARFSIDMAVDPLDPLAAMRASFRLTRETWEKESGDCEHDLESINNRAMDSLNDVENNEIAIARRLADRSTIIATRMKDLASNLRSQTAFAALKQEVPPHTPPLQKGSRLGEKKTSSLEDDQTGMEAFGVFPIGKSKISPKEPTSGVAQKPVTHPHVRVQQRFDSILKRMDAVIARVREPLSIRPEDQKELAPALDDLFAGKSRKEIAGAKEAVLKGVGDRIGQSPWKMAKVRQWLDKEIAGRAGGKKGAGVGPTVPQRPIPRGTR